MPTPAGGAPVVEMAGVRKRYGEVEALRGVDLRIEAGEVVAVLGPNGAGKTTAISLLLGLRAPTEGTVRLFGRPPEDRRARTRRGAMLQESGVPTNLTVRELVDMFRSFYPSALRRDDAIGMAGLADKAKSQAGTLSGGQLQRLYFALAVCGNPEALFLDEPTAGMDVAARHAFLDSIAEYGRQGRTIVLTTHVMDEADALADRIVVIARGRIIADDTPQGIKSRAAGKRVRFRTPDPIEPESLAALPVTGVSISGGEVSFLSAAPEPVLAELFRRGIAISELEVGGADLEDAFLALTGPEGPTHGGSRGPDPAATITDEATR
jgi:ABC-2 type transport system ATP-binding protein